MKPVGLTNTHQPDIKPYAVVQLRQDNKAGSLYNIVGFQTKMKYGEQKRVLRTIPGLENVEFARLGGIHRNTFINSPKVLDEYLSVKGKNKVKFAGQIIGVEGYVESAAMGLLAGIYKSHELQDKAITPVDEVTALGSLVKYITNEDYAGNFQPMNINFGLIPSIQLQKGEDKKEISAKRAMQQLQVWKNKYLQ
jgi:methylenetetrahydrofolate--tRNA-(uracil-5-)-methyltransferase